MITKTINLYTFDELSDAAKEKAREWWRDCEAQDFNPEMEPVETAAKLLGIELRQREVRLVVGKRQEPNIWWTLHVQGAGASFDGTYSYAKGSSKAVREEFPEDKALHAIADELAEIQKRYFYRVTAKIDADSRYHGLSVDADSVSGDDYRRLCDALKDFAAWIYSYVNAEWNYRMSDENVDDAILANDYTFTADGKRELR